MKTHRIISIFTLIISFSCSDNKVDTPTKVEGNHSNRELVELSKAQMEAGEIEVGSIEKRSISGVITTNGYLQVPPQSKVFVSAPMAGFVKAMQLLPGSKVTKGQVVAVIENQEYVQLQQEYLESFGQLEFLNAEYERQKELAKENINARKSLEQAKANYLTMKGRIEGLKTRLELLHISPSKLQNGLIQNSINLYAPISGYVTKVNTNLGAYVNPTDVLVEIVNTAELHVELTVYEKDISSIKEGQRVFFDLTNETKAREARVKLIGREISNERSVQVHCELSVKDKELIPGMYLSALIETENTLVMSLPDEAVVYFEGKSYVFVKQASNGDHTTFLLESVTLGKSEGGFVAVHFQKGFDLRQQVVTKGAFRLLAKLKNGEEADHSH